MIMIMGSNQDNLLKSLVAKIQSKPDHNYNLTHKKTWLMLIKDGIWPCTPKDIYENLYQLLNRPEYQPKGDKLLHLRSRHNFTLLPSGKPGRPEEALERLIVQSNIGHMYGQMPIGGGKESVDIVKLDNQTGTFIELKPWRSSNSPLYALLEGLKNLMLYRFLASAGHLGCNIIADVNLAVLAPLDYFQAYGLVGTDREIHDSHPIQSFLDAIAQEFRTRVTFFALDWSEEALWNVCTSISPGTSNENQVISVEGSAAIEALREKNWIELIAVR
jgi:hypothetical protein